MRLHPTHLVPTNVSTIIQPSNELDRGDTVAQIKSKSISWSTPLTMVHISDGDSCATCDELPFIVSTEPLTDGLYAIWFFNKSCHTQSKTRPDTGWLKDNVVATTPLIGGC